MTRKYRMVYLFGPELRIPQRVEFISYKCVVKLLTRTKLRRCLSERSECGV